MNDHRPDPDQLLSKIQQEEERAARGKLKIFFGASAGVGKTYAMLSAARQRLGPSGQGGTVVIGVIETHGRAETEAMAAGLERIPLREVPYRDRVLHEFDLDAALARHPDLILMDELAHSNVAGSRHPKRWQDIEELLAAGIEVWSTVNVQHLETLNDVVSGITGIRVWETVPDKVFDLADEVVLVDLPPDELLQRLKEGKVYLPQQAERAIRNFFRKGNLIALRELALRRTADRVDEEVQQYRRDKSVTPVWQTRESILVCLGAGEGGERIVRGTARLASRLETPWHVIYVETPELQRLPDARRHRVLKALKLAQDMGATTASLSGGDAVQTAVRYAREHNLSRVVVGRDHPRPYHPWYRSFADRLGHAAPDLDVLQMARSRDDSRSAAHRPATELVSTARTPLSAYSLTLLICLAAAGIAAPLYWVLDLSNIAMLFLLSVVVAALFLGRGPAIFAAVINVLAFDFLYVPPRFTFAVSDVQYLLTFAVMLGVGLLVGQLTAGLKFQATVSATRENRVRALYELSRDLSGALLPVQIAEACDRFAEAQFDAKAALLIADDDNRLQPPIGPAERLAPVDPAIAQWAFDHGEAAGRGTDTLPGSPALYLPLRAPMRVRGVMVLEPRDPERLMNPEQQRFLDTLSRVLAIAIERVHFVDVAQATTVQMESERLRNSLLSAISHDLRTPLAAMVGLADTLLLQPPSLSAEQQEVAKAMKDEARRMSSQVGNLLDMARLQAGRVELKRDWRPLDEVVGCTLRSLQAPLREHQVGTALADDLPLLHIDAALMERVLGNLLENAAKYTPPGSRIEIGAAREGSDVEVWVADNGPGLPVGKEEEIFKKFERGQKESATPGIGLGLAICRAIVEAHGGHIRAENRHGGGARFVFTLPQGNPPGIVDADSGGQA